VNSAEDGSIAWSALSTSHYDLVVTDNAMPCVSGLELLEMMHAAGLSIPVIMATGSLPVDAFARKPWLQPAATLIKPYLGPDLLTKVQHILSSQQHGERNVATPIEVPAEDSASTQGSS